MTRLIDADNIKWEKILEPLGNGMYVDGYVVNERDIDAMPTIEAIPISFLYEYMALCESVGAYKSKETIECLIDDWREEEKDEC